MPTPVLRKLAIDDLRALVQGILAFERAVGELADGEAANSEAADGNSAGA
jgi:hypothetical protein